MVRFFSVLFSIFFLAQALTACALFQEQSGPKTFMGPREEVIYASFEEVWRAVNIVMQPYPLRLSNMDEGLLETDSLKGYKTWEPPFKQRKPSGLVYKLSVRVVRGSSQGLKATKVIILKDAQVQRDFFSNSKQVPTDGLEEKVILYRIKREVQLERAVNLAQKRGG